MCRGLGRAWTLPAVQAVPCVDSEGPAGKPAAAAECVSNFFPLFHFVDFQLSREHEKQKRRSCINSSPARGKGSYYKSCSKTQLRPNRGGDRTPGESQTSLHAERCEVAPPGCATATARRATAAGRSVKSRGQVTVFKKTKKARRVHHGKGAHLDAHCCVPDHAVALSCPLGSLFR